MILTVLLIGVAAFITGMLVALVSLVIAEGPREAWTILKAGISR